MQRDCCKHCRACRGQWTESFPDCSISRRYASAKAAFSPVHLGEDLNLWLQYPAYIRLWFLDWAKTLHKQNAGKFACGVIFNPSSIRKTVTSVTNYTALQSEGATADQPSFCATAAAAKDLADENSELQGYLVSNAELIRKLEKEVLHAESLSVQLLQSRAVC